VEYEINPWAKAVLEFLHNHGVLWVSFPTIKFFLDSEVNIDLIREYIFDIYMRPLNYRVPSSIIKNAVLCETFGKRSLKVMCLMIFCKASNKITLQYYVKEEGSISEMKEAGKVFCLTGLK